ncbi:hypothetical protein BXZ70DRAFT_946606 [Cristinia sonorae]|uniref:Amidohydrolase-related domain-containing protein n=1 Tax=Cristinia sonorae TaxID=1940300 RepID=A0A8K0UM12_9AGAR|nr:hypothetical protein BXZ70DRAFT_946606 [Cristinia sonorae]
MSSKVLSDSTTSYDTSRRERRGRTLRTRPILSTFCAVIAGVTLFACNYYVSKTTGDIPSQRIQQPPFNAQRVLAQCASLKATVGPSESFSKRNVSDRFEPGTNATWIRNARIWTGAENGTETLIGDILLKGGIVKRIGHISDDLLEDVRRNLTVVDAEGAWVTPGLVDLHSHLGLISAPFMKFEVGSPHGPIVPWVRSIDGLHTHDDAFEQTVAGGVTTVQVLPGSGNAIGGQAFMVKLRKTKERSPTSMLLEPPYGLNGSEPDSDQPLRWRHLKQACGENLSKWGTRMDAIWAFRQAYDTARKIKQDQDDYCLKAESGLWTELKGKDYPESFQWEVLVDVLRGRVKIAHHCYEEVDLDDIVRLSNEFKFHVASFHHASEAWLVPDVLKRMFGGPPAVAIFASNHGYKRESYRGSVFAPRVLADNAIPVVMKSDHPVINSRYLLHEAQQAHYYGLPPHLALSSVTSTPAHAAGMNHRIGRLAEGVDADVVLWDSHPLQLGATPRQVWIDGIPQLTSTASPSSILVGKPKSWKMQDIPHVPKFSKERKAAVKYEGLPPLQPKKLERDTVVFKNVRQVWMRGELGLRERWTARPGQEGGIVVLKKGAIACVGKEDWCFDFDGATDREQLKKKAIDLHGGAVGPGMMTFGSPLGVEEIDGEASTQDGALYNPFTRNVPNAIGDPAGLVRAVDALQFQTRYALNAHKSGVTYATSSLGKVKVLGGPQNIISGLSTTFRTGSAHALDTHAIVKEITAIHLMFGRSDPLGGSTGASVSTEIATLRRLLLDAEDPKTDTGKWFQKAAEGSIPLIIHVNGADIMAALLRLKAEIEDKRGSQMRLVFSGASEAHILAKQIAGAKVGIILTTPRPLPGPWDGHRILSGPPLTNNTTASTLLEHGVTFALGCLQGYEAAHVRFEAGWIARELGDRADDEFLYALVTTNLEKLLGMEGWIGEEGDLVAYDGGSPFDFESKVVAVASPKKGVVELF